LNKSFLSRSERYEKCINFTTTTRVFFYVLSANKTRTTLGRYSDAKKVDNILPLYDDVDIFRYFQSSKCYAIRNVYMWDYCLFYDWHRWGVWRVLTLRSSGTMLCVVCAVAFIVFSDLCCYSFGCVCFLCFNLFD